MSEVGAIYARELVSQCGLKAPVDLNALAIELGLEVREEDSDSIEGALIRAKKQALGIIVVNKNILEVGRKRFTIAHEIGHFLIPNHGQAGVICNSEEIESYSPRIDPVEEEANQFAAELLIPYPLLDKKVAQVEPTMENIRWIANTFQASLTASAFRLIDLTDYPAAIVWSQDGRIKWFRKSADFTGFIRAGDTLDEGTVALRCFQGKAVTDDFNRIPADLWVELPSMRPDLTVLEHSIFMPRYQGVLSLLYFDEQIGELEPEALEELDPKEFTLERKRWPSRSKRRP